MRADAAPTGRRGARAWAPLYTGNAGTYYAGIETVPAALAGVLVYIYPVFVAVLSLRFATRLPGRRPWIALGLALVGVVLALGGIDLAVGRGAGRRARCSSSPRRRSTRSGSCSRPGCPASGATGSARTRRPATAPASDAAVTTALMMTATAIVFAVMAVALGRSLDPRSVPGDAWPYLVGIGFVASFLAIQTLYAGARRVGAAQAALISTTEPLFIVVLAFLVLDQTLAPIQLVGRGVHPGRRRHRPDRRRDRAARRSRRPRSTPRSRARLGLADRPDAGHRWSARAR